MRPKDPKNLKVGEIVQYVHYDYDDNVRHFEHYKIVSIDRHNPAHALFTLENIEYPFNRTKYYCAAYSAMGLQRANALVKLGHLQRSCKPSYKTKRVVMRTVYRVVTFYRKEVRDLLLMFVVGVAFVSLCLAVVGLILLGIVYPFIG